MEDAPRSWTDVWALCRREHGLNWVEFEELTLAQLEALEERRAIDIRQARFNAALITATLVNAHRSADAEVMSPFDLLAGFERDEEEEEKKKARSAIRHAVVVALSQIKTWSAEAQRAELAAMIRRMEAAGVEDPEGIVREVFPDL